MLLFVDEYADMRGTFPVMTKGKLLFSVDYPHNYSEEEENMRLIARYRGRITSAGITSQRLHE
ncbi:hypothetical protein CDL15_Pgr005218 [Punica granatum]|uniref:Uncharacterized protein n=1 Tax=Punica granatum TaxID=22663 RepID=A0A218WQ96_PUNGR|nr:hypothetical protein CDL15_Pgr005218 [Punica granatum]